MSARASSNFVASGRSRRGLLWWLGVCVQIAFWSLAPSALAQTAQAPAISNVEIVNPDVARYEKLEIAFDVETSATQLNLPFDENPPPGLRAGEGISVDALFSNDNFQTTITQPAFFYQPFDYQFIYNRDHWTPDGAPYWLVRFAPRAAGEWQVRLRVQDQDGTTIFPENGALHFRVHEGGVTRYDGLRQNPYTRRGLVRVSENDPRYFEFEDGAPFVGLGYGSAVDSIPNIEKRFRAWQLNGLQFARVWMSGLGINGSQWTPWAFPKQPFTFGTPDLLVDNTQSFGDATFSFRLDQEHPCMFADFWQGGIPVKPNTAYSVTVRAKLTNVAPKENAPNAGLAVIHQGWLDNGCGDLNAASIVPSRIGTTDWYTTTGTLTTGDNQQFLDFLYLALNNTRQGSANIDFVALVARDDPNAVNLLRRPRADSHLYFDAMNAAKWDRIVEIAAQHGIYLKVVTDEKNEWIKNVIRADGTLGKFDNNNFYAAPDTPVRWLEQAWWRYLIARWGYSTAIHSFEYINEGDPFNGNHYDAAEAMAEYFQAHDPAQHMVTTSMWHSFPSAEFWANPKYSALAYADLHAYITTGWGPDASFTPPSYLEKRPEFVHSGNASFHIPAAQKIQVQITPRTLALAEQGEWVIRYWMKAENFQAKCAFGETGGQQRVQWILDGGAFNGGRDGYVPLDPEHKGFLCGSPDGTFDWREFSSQRDRDGNALPLENRLLITDTRAHELHLYITNAQGVSGDAWIDDVEIISPSGVRVPVIGDFDATPFTPDTAWLTAAYSLAFGGASPVGAHKPLVRGETGLNSAQFPDGLPTVNKDVAGIWLHNFVWGQINSGGMYDLLWWGSTTIENNPKAGRQGDLYSQFLPFARFMADVPLGNGHYQDAQATASDPRLRVWGQRDDVNGRAHLWIQNIEHTWTNVVAGKKSEPISGSIVIPHLAPGTYQVEWWDTYNGTLKISFSQTVSTNGEFTLSLPEPITRDIAVKIERVKP